MSADLKTTISGYLSKMGFSPTYDEQKNQFRTVIKLKNDVSGAEFDFPIAVTLLKDWVVTECAIVDLNHVPSSISLEKMYDGMLRANFTFPEINYALYNSTVVSLAWNLIPALSYENFHSEFLGVLSGVEKFSKVVSYAQQVSSPPPKEFAPIYQ